MTLQMNVIVLIHKDDTQNKRHLCVNLYNDRQDHDALGKRHCNSSMTH